MSAPIASNLSLWWHIMYKLGDGGKAARDERAMLQMHALANLIAKLDVPVRLQVLGAGKHKGIGPARKASINTALHELLAAANAGPIKTPPQDYYTPSMLNDNPWASQEDRSGLTPSQEAACAADPWAAPASAGANTAAPAPTVPLTIPALLGLGQLMPWPQVADRRCPARTETATRHTAQDDQRRGENVEARSRNGENAARRGAAHPDHPEADGRRLR